MLTSTKRTWGIPIILVLLLTASLACEFIQPNPPPPDTATPTVTRTPKIGSPVFGVVCEPAVTNMLHGDIARITLVDKSNSGKLTHFKIGSISGPQNDPGAGEVTVSQDPAPPDSGWSTLPGAVIVNSTAVHGPYHIKTYFFNILLGGSQGEEVITGGNIWCQVDVVHKEPPPITTTTLQPPPPPADTPTVTPTPTSTPAPTATPSTTPHKVKPSLYVTSPVHIGYDLVVKGTNFPPGAAEKWLVNPEGKILYQASFTIKDNGLVNATFHIRGPGGKWYIVIKYKGGEMRVPFDVIK